MSKQWVALLLVFFFFGEWKHEKEYKHLEIMNTGCVCYGNCLDL